MEKLWNKDFMTAITGVPWDPVGTMQRGAQQDQEPQKTEEEMDGKFEEAPGKARGMQIKQPQLDKFGYSENCRKCRLLQRGDYTQPSLGHSQACKQRIRELSLKDAEFAARARAGQARVQAEQGHRPQTRTPEPEQNNEVQAKRARISKDEQTQEGESQHP